MLPHLGGGTIRPFKGKGNSAETKQCVCSFVPVSTKSFTIVRPPQPGGMVACTNAGLVKMAEQLFPSYIREQPPSVLQYILVHCVYWNTK